MDETIAVAAETPVRRAAVVEDTPEVRRRKGRSRLTNHKDLLPGVDQRCASRSEARRFRDLVNAYLADSGGVENCSEIRIGLVRWLAAITVQGEILKARLVSGEQVDVTQLCTLASTAVRLSQRLGLERKAKTVNPTLSDYLRDPAVEVV